MGNVPANATADYAYKLTLSVTAALTEYGQRSSQAEIVISISPADAPIVSVQYVTPKKINPLDKLKIMGTVGNVKSTAVNCTWSLDDASIHLLAVATTPTSVFLMPSKIQSVLNFALSPASLRERATFTFTLSCLPQSSARITRSSLEVSTNGPPLAGEFIVMPERGIALNTSFMFLSSKWFDEDLPLSYHYGFVSSDALITLQSRSEILYGNSTLPVGEALLNFRLQLFAQIFDVMNAQSTVYKSVTVDKAVVSTKQLNALISTELTNGASSVDNTKKVIGLVNHE